MSDYNSALYFAREAAIKYQKSGKCWDAEDAAQRLVGLLAALDAARGEVAGEAGTMPGTAGFTMACFRAEAVPVGTKLYAAPPAARDETPVDIGGESVPRWVVEYADALTTYHAERGGGSWAIGGVQSREQAPHARDAARGEAVAWADDDEIKRSRHYGGSFNAWLTKYPGKDTPLYAAPPAALADAFAIAHKAAKMTADACKSATGRHGTINQFVNLVQIAHDASAQAQQPAAAVPEISEAALDAAVKGWTLDGGIGLRDALRNAISRAALAQQPAAEAPGDVQRDAARYRYLRREGAWEQHDLCVTGSVSAIFVSDGRVGHATEGAQLDAAIDRAMLAAAKKD